MGNTRASTRTFGNSPKAGRTSADFRIAAEKAQDASWRSSGFGGFDNGFGGFVSPAFLLVTKMLMGSFSVFTLLAMRMELAAPTGASGRKKRIDCDTVSPKSTLARAWRARGSETK